MYDIIRQWAIDNKINVTAGQGRLLELLVEEKFKSTNKQSMTLEVTHGTCRECGKETYNLVLLCEDCE